MLVLIFMGLAYLLGSLCSAIFVCKFMKLGDPRTEGSKNPGATNVLRLAGKQAAMVTLLADGLKGFVPVFLAFLFGIKGFNLGLVALAAVLGHIYPLYFQFKGGKGVATALGAVTGLSLLIGILAIVAWVILAALFRYASLASLVAVSVAMVLTLIVDVRYFLPMVAMTALIFWGHWENIQRLQEGREDKLDLG